MKPLKKLKELHAKTTQGEWFRALVFKPDIFEIYTTEKQICHAIYKNDVEFITEAHKYLPRLIEALDDCIKQRDKYIRKYLEEHYQNRNLYEETVKEVSEVWNRELEQIMEGKDE